MTDTILVLLETTPARTLTRSAAGLLAAARELGTAVALVVGDGEVATLADEAMGAGAERVLVARGDATALTVPVVDALDAAFDRVSPAAVLVPNSVDGRDAAARFAARRHLPLAAWSGAARACWRGTRCTAGGMT